MERKRIELDLGIKSTGLGYGFPQCDWSNVTQATFILHATRVFSTSTRNTYIVTPGSWLPYLVWTSFTRMQKRDEAELGIEYTSAIDCGDLEALTKLVSSHLGANNEYTLPTQAIMRRATMTDKVQIVSWCIDRLGGNVRMEEVMSIVVASGAVQTHRMFVEEDHVPIDYYVPWFGTALAVAADSGNFEWTKFCLEKGQDPNVDRVDEYKPVIAAAAEGGHIDVVRLLLDHDAVLNGSGAIVLAAGAGKKSMIEFLLQQGASINEIGLEDPTDERVTEDAGAPLHMAAEAGHKDVVELLLEKGANIDLTDLQGRTALDRAEQSGHGEIIQYLRSRGAK